MALPPRENPNDPLLISQFSGLVNTVNPERLSPDDLVVAKNVDIDDLKQLRRRRGYTQKIAGDFHSLYTSSRGTVYVVREGVLCVLHTDYQYEALDDTVGSEKVAYEEISNTLYWSNRVASGQIDMRSNYASPWGSLTGSGEWVSPVVQPTPTLGEVAGKLQRNPPTAEYLAYYNGRIYMARENTIWATELYLYDRVDATRTFLQFEAEITGMKAVSDGFYVGTTKGLFFLSGRLDEMRRMTVNPNPVIRGSMIPGDPSDFPQNPTRLCVLALTEAGLCVCFDGGVCKNLTSDKFWFPTAASVAAVNRSQDGISQYVGVVDSGGSPASGTRIGDYVDAEIRRFQGA